MVKFNTFVNNNLGRMRAIADINVSSKVCHSGYTPPLLYLL